MPKPKSRAGFDTDRVARMMREAEGEGEPVAVILPDAPTATVPIPAPAPTPVFDPGKVDGRTLRRTGREPFATRIKPETHETMRRIAYARGLSLAEVVEMAVAAFDKKDT